MLKQKINDVGERLARPVHCSPVSNSQEADTTYISQMEEWAKTMWSAHTMEYILPLKRGNSAIRDHADKP